MKKLVSILALAVMVLTVTGCYSSYDYEEDEAYVSQESKPQSKPQVEVEKEPEEIELTVENIDDYLTFILNTKEVELEDWNYEIVKKQRGKGKLSVKGMPKKRGDFNGVILNVTLTSSSEGWIPPVEWEERKKEIVVSLDGEFEEEYKINSIPAEFVYDEPKFELIINSVTGTFTEN